MSHKKAQKVQIVFERQLSLFGRQLGFLIVWCCFGCCLLRVVFGGFVCVCFVPFCG